MTLRRRLPTGRDGVRHSTRRKSGRASGMSRTLPAVTGTSGGDVIEVRGQKVMLDSVVAAAFGVETKRVNEAVARNSEKFGEAHCFRLTEAEAQELRSQTATSKDGKDGAPRDGRGGPRYLPHVFTVKGVARLATVLTSPAALKATDLIIDTFLMVHEQLRRGRSTVAVREPERFRSNDERRETAEKLRTKLNAALGRLLDTIADVESQQSVRQLSRSVGSKALQNVQERLREKGLQNEKLEADTALVIAQAEKTLAEARKANLEADGLDIANFERKIAAVKKVADLMKEIEPDEVVGLLGKFEGKG